MKHCISIVFFIVFATGVLNKELTMHSPPGPQLRFYSGIQSDETYSNETFLLYVEIDLFLEPPFYIEASSNQYIFKLKEAIQHRSGYRLDQQRLHLCKYMSTCWSKKLKDGGKLGDYGVFENNMHDYQLFVTKRNINRHMNFTATPNVTHYEYAMMSYHVYEPSGQFLDGWNVTVYNPPNKNDLVLAAYVNVARHQCVISIRGTVLTGSVFYNLLTDLRLFFTNQAIDIYDAARAEVHDALISIPGLGPTSYDISFTGHSLGAALAESFACTYQAYAVTFDSPGTERILNNDPDCQKNIRNGYQPQERIRTYLGTYANIINVANPQSGKVFYLKQFGVNQADEFFYIYSSAFGVYLAACISTKIVDKSVFKLALWFAIGNLIKESSIVSSIHYFFDCNYKILNIFEWCARKAPFILTVIFLCHSIDILATSIERRMRRLYIRSLQVIGYIGSFVDVHVRFNSVLCQLAPLCFAFTISCLFIIGIPAFCYLWWLKSAHAIDKFVKSFNPITGNAYKEQSIKGTLWPTFFEHLTEHASQQFLLCLLLIQSMKPVAFHLLPPEIPKRIRLNIILVLFAIFINIDSKEHLIVILVLFLVVFIRACQINNVHYAKDLLCAVTVLQFMIYILSERHDMNKLSCEIVCYPMALCPFFRRLLLIS